MAYIDESGCVRNSKEDLAAFQEYCRDRVKLMKNTVGFLKEMERDYDRLFVQAERRG